MSMKSIRGIFFGGFWVEVLALEAIEYEDQDEKDYLQIFSVEVGSCKEWDQECSYSWDHSPPLSEELEKVNRMTQRVWVIDTNMRKDPSEKHSVGKCHIGTLGHTYHSVSDVVGKVEVFSNGEAVEHVAQTRVRMVLVFSETYGILTQDDFLFLGIDFQPGNNHLKRVKEGINPFHLSSFRLSSFIE
ncbi:hypothetical protein Tco_0526899 [Tanacetum coccineum]